MESSAESHCSWCGVALSAGERFRFELRHAGWLEGGLLVEENHDFEQGREPVPLCAECEQSIIENYEGMRTDQSESVAAVYRSKWYRRVLVLALFVALVVVVRDLVFRP